MEKKWLDRGHGISSTNQITKQWENNNFVLGTYTRKEFMNLGPYLRVDCQLGTFLGPTLISLATAAL